MKIGSRENDEFADIGRMQPFSQATNRSIADGNPLLFRLEIRRRGEMVRHERYDAFDKPRRSSDAREKRSGGIFSTRFVIPARDSRSGYVGGRGFAQVVTKRSEKDGECGFVGKFRTGYRFRRLVESQQRMDPNVSFGMPNGVLRSGFERIELGIISGNQSDFLRGDEA